MSRPFGGDGIFIPSKRAQALKPWPIMGYEMPRTVQGVEIATFFEKEIFGFVISIKRKKWRKRRIIPK